MPSVTHLDIAPVMSLGLERRDEITVTERGVVEDRRFFIVDDADRLIDQLLVADMVQVQAWTDPDATVLRLTFPDGRVIEDDVRPGPAFDGVIRRLQPQSHEIEGPWAEPLSAFMGRSVRVIRCDRPGSLQKDGRLSMVTDASLDKLGHHLGAGDIDGRRFRMLINLAGDVAHEEDTWIGHRVGLGDTTLRVTGAIPRCAMTTHDPDTGGRDHDTLRAIKEYRGFAGPDGKDLMFGVYGDVERPGTIRVGDEVRVLD
jgi:uncharacterized protein YcbX